MPRSRTKSMFHTSIHESTSLSTDNEDTSSAGGLARGGLTPFIFQRILNHVSLLTTHMYAHARITKRSISRNQTYICKVPYTVITRGRQSLKRSIIHAACITSYCGALFDPRAENRLPQKVALNERQTMFRVMNVRCSPR